LTGLAEGMVLTGGIVLDTWLCVNTELLLSVWKDVTPDGAEGGGEEMKRWVGALVIAH
jgi:hypothetical protein